MKVFTLEELIELLRAEAQSLDEDRMNFLDFITPEMEKKLNLIDYNEFEANLHEGALLFKEKFSEIYSLHPLKDLPQIEEVYDEIKKEMPNYLIKYVK